MVDYNQYPNPLRLFSQTRDVWFKDFVEGFGVPMHVFAALRETQIGQLLYAIEDVRLKKIRSGEDAGPGMLEGDNLDMFVPLFNTIKQMRDYFAKEEVSIDFTDIKTEFLENKMVQVLIENEKTASEFYSSPDFDRLDQLYLASSAIIHDFLIPKLSDAVEEAEGDNPLEKVSSVDETLGNSLKSIAEPDLYKTILEKTYEVDKEDENTRILSSEDPENPKKLTIHEYHAKTNILYSILLEIHRLLSKGKKYSKEFGDIPFLLSFEMLLMIPQPDKTRIPVIKYHLSELAKKTSTAPKEFYDIISASYQGFCRIFNPNPKLFRKMIKGLENSLKQSSRIFWKKMMANLDSRGPKKRLSAEKLIAVLWCHFRVVQAQTQNIEQQQHDGHDHQNYSYRYMLRFEQIFWHQGKDYLDREKFNSDYHFWAKYAKIANKEIRNPKDSMILYNQYEDLFKITKVFTNKIQREKLNVNVLDHKTLLNTILSYGLEAKEGSIYPDLKKYSTKLSKLLDQVEKNQDDYPSISLEQERNVVESINKYLEQPIEAAPLP